MSSLAICILRRITTDMMSFDEYRPDTVDAFISSLELVYHEILVQEQLHHPLQGPDRGSFIRTKCSQLENREALA